MFNIRNYKTDNIKNDILSGLVVAVALVPEAIAFSFIVGINPIVGLYTAFILGLITSLFGGKPGMISGATGSVAVVLVGLAIESTNYLKAQGLSGDELAIGVLSFIALSAILAGVIQMVFGLLKLGKFIRLVPLPAIYGFVNGLAIVIAMAQFKFFNGEGWQMYLIVFASMAIMYLLPKFTKVVPSGLVAIVALTLVVYFLHLDTKTIGDLANIAKYKGQLPTFSIPDTLFSLSALKMVLPYAIIAALVGLIESLLTLAVLDELSGKRGSGNKESFALGLGNFTCGFFGAMPGCAMIGQSVINYTSGGLGRLSSFTASVGLMMLVAYLTDILQLIPIAVLVGIMFMVSIGTFEWSSFSHIKTMPKEDAFIMIAVTIITIFFDLAVAVIIGAILSALMFAWKHARIHADTNTIDSNNKQYKLNGPLFFASVESFMYSFDIENDPQNITVDFKNTRVLDASGAEAIESLYKKYKDANKNLTLQHLSKDCIALLKQAKSSVIKQGDDPEYKVVRDY
jgi:SulP family sulfate permease